MGDEQYVICGNKAVEWYSKSSEGGNVKAMYRLAYHYSCGYGVKKDMKKAFEFYLKSAEGGYTHALCAVGDCYYYGNGVFKDESKAFEWYLRASEKGFCYYQYLVADYYNNGRYVSKDEEKGFYCNRKAAISGYICAQHKLAADYLNRDKKKAFKWYLKLANENSLKAIYLVAKCYRDGIGTDKNSKEATKWIKRYEEYGRTDVPIITSDDFLNGSDINASKIDEYIKFAYEMDFND
ncbi:hypothetical protein C1645_698222 [Glomus cerebriforme]|uniref:HCP-like protein n=1 Tax=Glomus cerebriforme TaxID=658196 RepID=A0A397SJT2_9GLOM|nr:hypothetical protein C1645_698222 [Glomus cerebriforme]